MGRGPGSAGGGRVPFVAARCAYKAPVFNLGVSEIWCCEARKWTPPCLQPIICCRAQVAVRNAWVRMGIAVVIPPALGRAVQPRHATRALHPRPMFPLAVTPRTIETSTAQLRRCSLC